MSKRYDDNVKPGVNQDYNKENRDRLWDSTRAKREYKEKAFEGKKTLYDEISGETLHYSQSAAQEKYHMKNRNGENTSTAWARHASEVDHIVPLKEIHNRVKANGFISDHELKEIANQEYNYRITSKSFNTSKGEKNDLSIALNPNSNLSLSGRRRLIEEKTYAELFLNTNIAAHTVQNVSAEFCRGAVRSVEDSLVPLTSEAIRHLCKTASGEETLDQAAESMRRLAAGTALYGGAKRVITQEASVLLQSSKSELIQKIASSQQFGQIITLALLVEESAIRYIEGQISGEEFVHEIGEKGVNMVAGMIGGEIGKEIGMFVGGMIGTTILPGAGTTAGMVAGRVIGEVLGVIITTVSCSTILSIRNVYRHLDDFILSEQQMQKLEKAATREIENQRAHLKNLIQVEYNRWDGEILAGFETIIQSACMKKDNAAGIAKGLDKILALVGSQAAFHTVEEYEQQLDTTLTLKIH